MQDGTRQSIAETAADRGLQIIGDGRNQRYCIFRFLECGHTQEILSAYVRSGGFECKQCRREKLVREAVNAGLEMLGPGTSASNRLYQFKDCGHGQVIGTGRVRDGGFRCNSCLDAKLVSEAQEAGLELVGGGISRAYRQYRFIACGHEQQIQTSAVRRQNVRCHTCDEKKLADKALSAGIKFIGAGKNKNYRKYQFLECGHQQEFQPSLVRRKRFRCQKCFEIVLKTEAHRAGVELLGPAKSSTSRHYRKRHCGHHQDIRTEAVRSQTFRCDQCLLDKLEQEALDAGLKIVGAGRNAGYRKYQFRSCGHFQELTTGHVRLKNFVCNQCEETSRDLPSSVYLIEFSGGGVSWLKLGYAKTVESRIRQYGLARDCTFQIVAKKSFETGREAHAFEAELHKKYKARRMSRKKFLRFSQRVVQPSAILCR